MGKFPWDAPDAVAVELHCPPIKGYSKATTDRMTREIRALRSADPNSVTPTMMRDYNTLRDQCRVIQQPSGAQ